MTVGTLVGLGLATELDVRAAFAQPPPSSGPPCASMPPTGAAHVRYAVHDYDAPERLQRFVIHDRNERCPPDPMPGHLLSTYAPQICVGVSTHELAQLRAVLDRLAVRTIRVHAAAGVHRGGVEIELGWLGGACRIADVTSDLRIVEADRARFRAVDEAVRAVIARALAP